MWSCNKYTLTRINVDAMSSHINASKILKYITKQKTRPVTSIIKYCICNESCLIWIICPQYRKKFRFKQQKN